MIEKLLKVQFPDARALNIVLALACVVGTHHLEQQHLWFGIVGR